MSKKPKAKLLDAGMLKKKYKSTAGLASEILLPKDTCLWLPSRNIVLNYQLGGGVPYGKIIEEFGYESTGKSLLAMDFGVVTQKLGGVVLWGDIEGSFNIHWAEQNGLDSKKVELFNDNSVEGFSDWSTDMIIYYRNKLTHNEPILLVGDSIAAFECEENINTDQLSAKAEMGNRAKAIFKMYRNRNSRCWQKYGVCVVMVNQVRKKVGASMFEDAETTPGGDSTKFYATQRLALIRSRQIKGYLKKNGEFKEDPGKKGKKIGQHITMVVRKNKAAPPRPSVKTAVYFDDMKSGYVGFDRYAGIDLLLLEQGIIVRKGNSYFFKKKLICKKKDDILPTLVRRPKLRKKILDAWGVNTISKTRERIKALSTNLFPVKLRKSKGEDDEEE